MTDKSFPKQETKEDKAIVEIKLNLPKYLSPDQIDFYIASLVARIEILLGAKPGSIKVLKVENREDPHP